MVGFFKGGEFRFFFCFSLRGRALHTDVDAKNGAHLWCVGPFWRGGCLS